VSKEINEGTLVQLRAFLAQGEFAQNQRLPPERELCEQLGASRSELRKALAVLESEGAVWRHVGKGTFIGNGNGDTGEKQSIANIAKRTTPQQVMQARLVLEPQLAKQAALHATAEHMEQLHENCITARKAETWRQYETLDNRFHGLISLATQNIPLIAMYDQLNALRRTVVWGRLRTRHNQPPEDHHSFAEHESILQAIENRDTEAALLAMKTHLRSVNTAHFPEH